MVRYLTSQPHISISHVRQVIYEWADWQYLGVETSITEDYLPVSLSLPPSILSRSTPTLA